MGSRLGESGSAVKEAKLVVKIEYSSLYFDMVDLNRDEDGAPLPLPNMVSGESPKPVTHVCLNVDGGAYFEDIMRLEAAENYFCNTEMLIADNWCHSANSAEETQLHNGDLSTYLTPNWRLLANIVRGAR